MVWNVGTKHDLLASTEMPETNFCTEGGSTPSWESPHLLQYTLEALDRSILVVWYFFTTVDIRHWGPGMTLGTLHLVWAEDG